MIALLTGILRHVDNAGSIVDVSGVGYQVATTARTQSLLGAVGAPVTLHIVTQVREDAITLFGFSSGEEKDAFNKLTTVQGVGAKMALSLLGTLTPTELWQAILADNKKLLTAADGVGPKLAARLVTELKDWCGKQVFPAAVKGSMKTAGFAPATQNNSPQSEAISALMNLGYAPMDATRAVTKIANENSDADLSTLIRLSLREVSA